MGILDLIFPKNCLGCNKEGVYVCALCLAKVKTPACVCPVCERPSIDGFTHVKCLTPQGINGLICVWEYEAVVRKAILGLKYKYATEIVKEMAPYAVRILKRDFPALPKEAILTPVPLHKRRLNARGFNQSEVLGILIAKKLGWGFAKDLLIRKRARTPQAELKKKKRIENVRGVFAFNPKYKGYRFERTLVIFDDVWTTGSTIKEVAKVLKRANAMCVWGLTLAR